jgi:hypothetical protein
MYSWSAKAKFGTIRRECNWSHTVRTPYAGSLERMISLTVGDHNRSLVTWYPGMVAGMVVGML